MSRSCRDTRSRFLHRDEPGLRELAPAAADAGRARDPQHGLQVAQASGALLHVRLEVVGRVVILEMPLLLFQHLRFVERRNVHRRGDAAAEGAMQAARAGDVTMLEQARLDGDVARHLVGALRDRAHAVAHFEPDVPEDPDQPLDERRPCGIEPARQQDQDVDVGVRVELAATVAADGDERDVGRRAEIAPDRAR